MQEIKDLTTNLKSECKATTESTTPNTSSEIVPFVESNEPTTTKSHSEPDKKPNEERLSGYEEVVPYRLFLINELASWIFESDDGRKHNARHCPTEEWVAFFSDYADLEADTDWTDLEERADLLTQLWEFCAAEGLPFPLTCIEKPVENEEEKALENLS